MTMNDNERLLFQKALDCGMPMPPMPDGFALRMAERIAAERESRERRAERIAATVTVAIAMLCMGGVCVGLQLFGILDFGAIAGESRGIFASVDMRSVIPHADPSMLRVLLICAPAIALYIVMMLFREVHRRRELQ